VADELDREAQQEELRADLRELGEAAPRIVGVLDRAIDGLTMARQMIEEFGRGCRQVAEREAAPEQKPGG
jgi:hypothetical protein